MRMTLVGADYEENLGVGFIAAAAREAGHGVNVVPFNDAAAMPGVVAQILGARPDVVGLSIQFQHRAHEFLALAMALRERGFAGHVTCGGHFPTLAWREVLGGHFGVDSIVLHEGERTIVELLGALEHGQPLGGIAGLALPGNDGAPMRTAARALEELDGLPLALRYRPHSKHMGVPFIPILGSRGCWGSCSYCSITSFYRDARSFAGGRGHTLRLRTPERVAAEMAALWHDAGGPSLFCFHDENLLLPRPADSLSRLRAIRSALDSYGVGQIGIVGKSRPDCLTPELARELAALGVVRLYVGVENASEAGSEHLNRRTQTHHIGEALAACREAGIFVCYNLLVFEPEATLDDVRKNVAFMREHAEHPVNFCRAEAYQGTPLHLSLAERQELGGSFLGWNYQISDPRTELAFRISSAAFRQRNFDPEGVANRSMGLGYSAKLLEHFHAARAPGHATFTARSIDLTREIVADTARFLDEALDLAATAPLDDSDRIERETGLLGLRIAAADRRFHHELDELYQEMDRAALAAGSRPFLRVRPPRALVELGKRMALGASLAAAAAGFVGCDPAPPDGFIVDPVPGDLSHVDMRPAGFDADPVPDALGKDINIVDPAPNDLSMPDMGGVVDPLPPDMTAPVGMLTPRRKLPLRLQLIDQWRETSPEKAVRSQDIPLYAPPRVRLAAAREAGQIRVKIEGGPLSLGTRWESEGALDIEGRDSDTCRELLWTPDSQDSQLRVGIRAKGGVAILAIRARDVA